MKIVAYCALHYGASYLASAIRSVIDTVDEMHILYSAHPSHGSISSLPCPDTRAELYDIAQASAGNKLHWHDGDWKQENEQRNSILEYAPDADAIVIVDSDEIYADGLVDDLLQSTGTWHRRYIRVPFVHMYRDFHHAIMHDPAYPTRLIYPQIRQGDDTAATRPIVHFGYCQPVKYLRYKLGIHGHKHELAYTPDQYVDNIYLNRARWGNLHPVGSEWWNAELVNPLDVMPEWMLDHEYAKLDIVK